MMKHFRGRNLAHPGCLIGITAGLTFGIILAGILASVFNTTLNTALFSWLGLTVSLGAIGWFVGDRLSSRFPAFEEESETAAVSSGGEAHADEATASSTPNPPSSSSL